MNAATEFDLGPLTWVKGEIDAALDRASEALDQFWDSRDATKLKFCRTHVHQVHGALAIVGLDGVTQVTETLENLLAALEEDGSAVTDDMLKAVEAVILAIRQYLDDLMAGEPNQPLRLLPVYRALNEARGVGRFRPSDLFFPDLSIRPPKRAEPMVRLSPEEFRACLKRERMRFQKGLLALLRSPGSAAAAEGLGQMQQALKAIEATQETPAARTFWWVSQGLLDALSDQGVAAEQEVKQLCARIDLQIRRLLEGSRNVAERLLRDALYYIGQSSAAAGNGLASTIRSSFQLETLIPKLETAQTTAPQEAALRRLREVIVATEEFWNKFCAGSAAALSGFADQAKNCAQVTAVVGHTDLKRLGQGLGAIAAWLAEDPTRQSDSVAMEVATAILLLQNAQENFKRLGTDFASQVDLMVARLHGCISGIPVSSDAEVPLLDDMSRRAQEKLLIGQVAREIQSNLAQIEQALDTFFRDPEQGIETAALEAPIKQISGALSILGHDKALATLQECSVQIKRFGEAGYRPAVEDFEAVAQELSTLGFFIDSMQTGATDYEQFLRKLRGEDLEEQSVEEEIEEAAQEAPAASVEAELEQKKESTQALLSALMEAPEDERLKNELKQNLQSLQVDADLLADHHLGETAKAALAALESGASAAHEIDAALAPTLKAGVTEAPAPTAETLRLAQGSHEEIDAELLEIFLEEAQEVVGTIESELASLRAEPHNVDTLTNIRRASHTLKGSGRMVGLKDLGEVAWQIEQTLNMWLRQEIDVTPQLLNLIGQAHDVFAIWVRELNENTGKVPEYTGLVAEAVRLRGGEAAPAPAAAPAASEPIPEASVEEAQEISEPEPTQEVVEFAAFDLPQETGAEEAQVEMLAADQPVEVASEVQAGDAGEVDFALGDFAVPEEVSSEMAQLHETAAQPAEEMPLEVQEMAVAIEAPVEEPQVEVLAADQPEEVVPEVQAGDAGEIEFTLGDIAVPEEVTPEVAQLPETTTQPAAELAVQELQGEAQETATEPEASQAEQDFSFSFAVGEEVAGTPDALEPEPVVEMDVAPADEPAAEITLAELPEEPLLSEEVLEGELGLADNAAELPVDFGVVSGSIEVIEETEVQEEATENVEMESEDISFDAPVELPEVLPVDEMAPLVAMEESVAHVDESSAREENLLVEAKAEAAEDSGQMAQTLYDIFREEARQHLNTLQSTFTLIEADAHAPTAFEMTRAAHTLGGIAATVGLMPINKLAIALEHALLRRDHSAQPDSIEGIEIVRQAILALEDMFVGLSSQVPPESQPVLIDLLENVFDIATPQPAEKTAEPEPAEVTPEPEPESASAEIETENVLAEAVVPPPTVEKPAETLDAEISAVTSVAARLKEAQHLKDELDEQLLPIFLEEAQDLVQGFAEQLNTWRDNIANVEAPRSLARLLHTFKGGARMAGAMNLGEMTHSLESGLEDALRSGHLSMPLLEQIENGCDTLTLIVERLLAGESPVLPESALAPTAQQAVVEEAAAKAQAQSGVASAEAATPAPGAAPAPVEHEGADRRAQIRVRAELVDRLVNEAGELSIARARIEGEMRSLKVSLLDLTENIIRLRRQLREIEIQSESQMQARVQLTEGGKDEFDPLELDRFTRFQELTRFMAESVNDVATVQQSLLKNLDDTNAAIVSQARMTRSLQQDLMSIRMVPFSSQSERLYRIVRQTAKELGKRANLDIRGAHLELDRSVLDKMMAPIEHMLRNSVSHGIEDRNDRLAAGKTETGEITLVLSQEGNEIVLSMSDDGRGLDVDKIRARAESRGLLAPGQEIDASGLYDFIFQAGFSTATEVTQIAGRGVGMDVVKSEVSNLGGRIEILSTPGKGTTFRLYLPLTLTVMQTLLVRASGTLYAIPSTMIEQVLEVKEERLVAMRAAGFAEWKDNVYPFSFLPHLLGNSEALPESRRRYWVLLLRSGSKRVSVLVDELQGNQEVVIKNIGPQLARVVGLAGATVLGDGRVVLILNPVALAGRQAIVTALPATGFKTEADVVAEIEAETMPTVMVVDDSLTVRKITGRLLARVGYQVITAKDGVDALEHLVDNIPDVMISDIEMPRMDGFDLVRNVRADPRLQNLPVIMITSRTAEKHRNYALEIGANEYLGKPYDEDRLLELIAGFVKQKRSS
ncbi:MAG: hybrid sensor histidine kinase/response regulator [Proteobacteria bacterium]|nr:hybrid sensor histidine kinase/response regulator [Pseudomonadota bacterium]